MVNYLSGRMQSGKVNEKGNKGEMIMDRDIKDAFTRNLVWVITTLVTLGMWIATVQFQGKAVETQGALVNADHERIAKIEQTDIGLMDADERVLGRFSGLEARLKDLKETLEKIDDKNQAQFAEIKKILYKPAIGNNTSHLPSDTLFLSLNNITNPVIASKVQ